MDEHDVSEQRLEVDRPHPGQQAIVDAFLAASRNADFEALVSLLDPDVVLRADAATVKAGEMPEVRGAADVARTFAGRARFAQPAVIDGAPGAVWAPGGTPRVAFTFSVVEGRIVSIDLLGDQDHLAALGLTIVGN